ncbi:serine hydrolase [Kineococcus gypseus]|uniref:serine hydrolase n=1 Tax=Kineococcus gypseus TaxID=1637102 RepID=UPI003D7E740E
MGAQRAVRRRSAVAGGAAALLAGVLARHGDGAEHRPGRTAPAVPAAPVGPQGPGELSAAWAVEVGTGRGLAHDADRPGPLLALAGGLSAARLLAEHGPAVLRRRLRFSPAEVVRGSPVTCWHVDEGMTVAELGDAAVRRADATAANLLLTLADGPRACTGFCRELGDPVTRLDRWAPGSASARPWDVRDSTTARALGTTYGHLLLGDVLAPPQRRAFASWLPTVPLPGGWRLHHAVGTGLFGSSCTAGLAHRGGRVVLVAALVRGVRPGATGSPQDATAVAVAAVRAVVGAG